MIKTVRNVGYIMSDKRGELEGHARKKMKHKYISAVLSDCSLAIPYYHNH